MQLRLDAELAGFTVELQRLALAHQLLVCTGNRPFALALATGYALAPNRSAGQWLGICTKADEALDLVSGVQQPVLAFISEQLDDGCGLELVRQLKRPGVATVLTMAQLEAGRLRRALQGPCDVLLTQRGLHLGLLVSALEAIKFGQRFVDPVVACVLRDHPLQPQVQLSEREVEVLQLVCQGRTNREIGAALQIAETTARGHVQSIIQKLHVRDRTAAAAAGVRLHLVD